VDDGRRHGWHFRAAPGGGSIDLAQMLGLTKGRDKSEEDKVVTFRR
jgi:hypothetical protein